MLLFVELRLEGIERPLDHILWISEPSMHELHEWREHHRCIAAFIVLGAYILKDLLEGRILIDPKRFGHKGHRALAFLAGIAAQRMMIEASAADINGKHPFFLPVFGRTSVRRAARAPENELGGTDAWEKFFSELPEKPDCPDRVHVRIAMRCDTVE